MIEVRDAGKIVRLLDGIISFYKIGWPLFLAEGSHDFISELVRKGKRVFLDLKFSDIPETVERLISMAVEKHISFLTLNSGINTVRAAVEARANSDLKILLVTLLSSMDKSDLRLMNIRSTTKDYIVHRATQAQRVQCDGVICSGKEITAVRKITRRDFLIVSPGIRPSGSSPDDHKRSVTPQQAISHGADYLVVGRPIIRSNNPRDSARRIVDEMQQAFDHRKTYTAK